MLPHGKKLLKDNYRILQYYSGSQKLRNLLCGDNCRTDYGSSFFYGQTIVPLWEYVWMLRVCCQQREYRVDEEKLNSKSRNS